jgi:hypothetical protein
MGQVGHADSKMTLDVYAQFEQRIERDHRRSFDRLVRKARAQLGGEQSTRCPESPPDPIAAPRWQHFEGSRHASIYSAGFSTSRSSFFAKAQKLLSSRR